MTKVTIIGERIAVLSSVYYLHMDAYDTRIYGRMKT